MQKTQFCMGIIGNLLVNEKQKFVLLNDEVTEAWHLPLVVLTDTSFIIYIIVLISYYCFVSRSQ